ncbi:hypothetical protein Tco_0448295 [Tanacetum coccineum]
MLGFNFFSSTMGTIDSVKSILSQSALDDLCEKYYIHDVIHLELPCRNDRIRNSPTGKIGVYSRFLDFANYRIPLSQFFIDILEYFQINLSQLSVIAAAKVSHFEILCRVHGFAPTVDASVFPLSVPWHNDKTLRKDPHPTPAEFNVDVCNYLADNPAPFRKFLEPFLCFVGISRYYDLDENCYPTFWANDDEGGCRIGEREVPKEEVSLLQLTRGRVVPLASVNDQGNVNIQGAGDDDVNEGDGDVAEANQTEKGEHVVDVGGIDVVADDEVHAIVADKPQRVRKKRKVADGASGSGLPPNKLREDHGTFGIGANTGGKYVAVLQSLLESSTLPVEVGVTAATTMPFVTSSVTPDSISGTGLRTRHPAERFVIYSDSSHDLNANATDDEVTSVIRSSMPPPLILTAAVATTIIVGATSTPVHETSAGQVQPSIFRDSTSPSMAEADVAGPSKPTSAELLAEFNVGTARQVCFSADIRMRLEHELRGRQRFEGKCAMQANWLKERDAKIASLKAQLSFKEAEAAEAIRLHGQVANVKAAKAARSRELDGLRERNAALKGQVVALDSTAVSKDAELASSNAQIAKATQDLSNLQLSCDEFLLSLRKTNLLIRYLHASTLKTTCSNLRDEVMGYKLFKEQVEAMQDEQVKALSDCVAGIDFDLMEMVLHMDEEFYPRYLTTIAERRWILSRGLKLVIMKCLESPEYLTALGGVIGRAIDNGIQDGLAAGIDHGKAERGLVDVSAYNPSAEADYVAAINALRAVDFPLLAQLESRKDASMADIMDLLRLEGPAAETPEASQLQPSPEQLMVPIHLLEDQVVIRETSLSFSLDVAHNRIQRIIGDVAACRLSLMDVMVLLIKPLSASTVPPAPSTKVPPSPKIVFEHEELDTTSEHTSAP